MKNVSQHPERILRVTQKELFESKVDLLKDKKKVREAISREFQKRKSKY